MANSPQAIKRAKQNKRNAVRNRVHLSRMRTAIKKLLKAVETKEKEAGSDFNAVVSLIDHTASKGVIHPNQASRLKSRINKKLKLSQNA